MSKCCTYHPLFPNYNIGGILLDEDPGLEEGKKRILQKIQGKKGITPYGIIPPKEFNDLITKRREEGRLFLLKEDERKKLTCPFLDNGRCTVWKYRPELCMTYFCMPVSGANGQRFWNHLFQFIIDMERKLSLYALVELGYPKVQMVVNPEQIKKISFHNDDDQFMPHVYKRFWRKWEGKEADLYKESYRIISSLSQEDVEHILGWESMLLFEKSMAAFSSLEQNQIPNMLKFNPDVSVNENDPAWVKLQVGEEKIQLNRRRYLGLKQFDGNTTTYDILRANFGLTGVNSVFVQRMLKRGFLEDPEAEK